MTHNFKRRRVKNLFINRVQIKIALTNLAYMLLITVIIIVAVLIPLYQDMFKSTDAGAQYHAAKMFITVLERIAAAVILLSIIGFVHHIWLTHKLYGPLVSFGKTFDKIRQGDFTRTITLRRYDFLHEEAQQVNAMLDSLSQAVGDAQNHMLGVVESLERLKTTDPTQGEFELSLQQSLAHARAGHAAIGDFKVLPRQGSDPSADATLNKSD